MKNITEKVEKFYYVPSKRGFKKLADFNPSATLAPYRTIETGVVAEAISICIILHESNVTRSTGNIRPAKTKK